MCNNTHEASSYDNPFNCTSICAIYLSSYNVAQVFNIAHGWTTNWPSLNFVGNVFGYMEEALWKGLR